jgi:hypothetical protein
LKDHLPRIPEFWLLAVGENGTIAEMKFSMDSSPIVKGKIINSVMHPSMRLF